jgi:hypothetical protein
LNGHPSLELLVPGTYNTCKFSEQNISRFPFSKFPWKNWSSFIDVNKDERKMKKQVLKSESVDWQNWIWQWLQTNSNFG